MHKTYIFYVNGMTCSSCSNSIEKGLKNNKTLKLSSFKADLTTEDPKKVTIQLENEQECVNEDQWDQLKECIEDSGFSCLDKPEITIETQPTKNRLHQLALKAKQIISSHWFLGGLGCIAGASLLILSIATGGLPLAALISIGVLSTLITLALGYKSYYHAWKALIKSKSLTMDALFTISTLTLLSVSIASFFFPWLPMMFEAGLLIYGFRHIGLAIEESIKKKINPGKFQDRAPKTVTLLSNEELELNLVKAEDIILIKPGDLIPVDGFCEENTLIYETIRTGRTIPRQFKINEPVLAGMRLAEGMSPLRIRVEKPAHLSYLARLDEGIEQSLEEKAPLELITNRLLTYFIPSVIALAIIAGILIGIFFTPALAIQFSVLLLVSFCPCTLGLIVPLAVKTGMHKAAENGAQFKNPSSLQVAEQIDTLVFDLNGTLTTGIPEVKSYTLYNDFSPDQFLSLCANLEASSSHPVGKSIHKFCNIKKEQLPDSDSKIIYHSGLSSQIAGKRYTIGSLSLMQDLGLSTAELINQDHLVAEESLVFVAEEEQIIGSFILEDPLRRDALDTINALKNMGKDIHLCTGADQATALRYATKLGISEDKVDFQSVATQIEADDRSKPNYIKKLKNEGRKVAMIGDAANDVQAIASSDFGIAICSQNEDEQNGDELTQQHAGAVIQSDSLFSIVNAFEISKQTVSNIKYSLLFNLGFNIAVVLVPAILLVTIGFVLNPAIGAALMGLQLSLLLLYVYYFKEQPLEHQQEQALLEELSISEESEAPNPEPQPKFCYGQGLEFFALHKQYGEERDAQPFTEQNGLALHCHSFNEHCRRTEKPLAVSGLSL